LYTKAIELDPSNAILYGNRAATHLKLESYGSAVVDAQQTISLDPAYVKGYYRRGSAYMALGKTALALKDFRTAVKLVPKSREARNKFNECSKIVKQQRFAAAIASKSDKHSVLEELAINDMGVQENYIGPRFDEDKITLKFVKDMIEAFKAQKQIHNKYAYKILSQVKEFLQKQPSLVNIDVPEDGVFNVCGDVHGQFYDLIHIFEVNGFPSETNPYLFNGDFVDRGSFSCEVIFTLLSLKLLYPNHFFMARGNHETTAMNKIYGFHGEVKAKYTETMYFLFTEVFSCLPICHVIGGKYFAVHGGLPSTDGVKLEQIARVDRMREPGDSGLLSDLLWADPQAMPGRGPSKRGIGFAFGPDIVERFLNDNGLGMVIRSHEVKANGYEIEANGKLVTVFSAPNYCDQMGNKGALIRISGKDMSAEYITFDAVPHPHVPPMSYASPLFSF